MVIDFDVVETEESDLVLSPLRMNDDVSGAVGRLRSSTRILEGPDSSRADCLAC